MIIAVPMMAQPEVTGLPGQWAQYMQVLPLTNPASAGAEGRIEVNIGNQRALGLWRNNQAYFANANIKLGAALKTNRYHMLGAAFVGEKEGRYLHRNRAYLIYAYHLAIRDAWYLSAGAGLGMANFVAAANDFNGGGAAMAPDGNVGMWLRSDKSYIGLAHHQIFQSRLSPIWETTVLQRHWTLVMGHSFVTTHWLDIKLGAHARLVPRRKMDLDVNTSFVIKELVLAGANYRHHKGLGFMLGLEKIQVANSVVKGVFSYHFPMFSYKNSNIQYIEITLKYLLQQQKDAYAEEHEDQ